MEWAKIADDPSKHKDFLDKYGELMRERANLGAEDGSFSSKAIWADVDGKHTIVVQNYDGTDYALKEISYQGIKYWLRLLQHPVRRILSFLIDNDSASFSKSEIEHGACLYTYPDAFLYTDASSKILSKLEKRTIIKAVIANPEKKYRLNMANPETKDLIIPLCLWQKKNMIAGGLRGRTVKECIDPRYNCQYIEGRLIERMEQSDHYFSPLLPDLEDPGSLKDHKGTASSGNRIT